jgi:hypothetical protein
MKEFATPAAFAKFMLAAAGRARAAEQTGLEKGAVLVEAEAKASVGHYQAGWPQLSEATLEGFYHPLAGPIPGKIEIGYAPPDNPLLRTGALREDYEHSVAAGEAVVGSNSDIAVWQEMGTPDALYPIPARPVLAGAAQRKSSEVVDVMVQEVLREVVGGVTPNRWD